ncbi:hypothetical protein J2847_004110 [Azospirillum agricola]|uniref:hypothetical protein n=1 Tax=Azospirillum agricola TaxID=1720247 RepID=UPI001AE90DDA|nr:hypothetical protein [Azospirillum agricola]MBP2230801.1 hypothetical protein [Azospirillum agricola]
MTIQEGIHRARSYLKAPGVNRAKVAEAAGLNWHAVNNLLNGDARVSTALAIERVIPADFVAPPEDGATTPRPSEAA